MPKSLIRRRRRKTRCSIGCEKTASDDVEVEYNLADPNLVGLKKISSRIDE